MTIFVFRPGWFLVSPELYGEIGQKIINKIEMLKFGGLEYIPFLFVYGKIKVFLKI